MRNTTTLPVLVDWSRCTLTLVRNRFSRATWDDDFSAVHCALKDLGGSAPTFLVAAWLQRNGYADTELQADRIMLNALLSARGYLAVEMARSAA